MLVYCLHHIGARLIAGLRIVVSTEAFCLGVYIIMINRQAVSVVFLPGRFA